LVEEGLSDRDPLSVFVWVSLFPLLALLSILSVLSFFATTTPATTALSAATASSTTRPLAIGGLSIAPILRVLELLPQGVVHERGVVALHPEVVPLEPAPVCGALPGSLTR
jgi:hypothetical protein